MYGHEQLGKLKLSQLGLLRRAVGYRWQQAIFVFVEKLKMSRNWQPEGSVETKFLFFVSVKWMETVNRFVLVLLTGRKHTKSPKRQKTEVAPKSTNDALPAPTTFVSAPGRRKTSGPGRDFVGRAPSHTHQMARLGCKKIFEKKVTLALTLSPFGAASCSAAALARTFDRQQRCQLLRANRNE